MGTAKREKRRPKDDKHSKKATTTHTHIQKNQTSLFFCQLFVVFRFIMSSKSPRLANGQKNVCAHTQYSLLSRHLEYTFFHTFSLVAFVLRITTLSHAMPLCIVLSTAQETRDRDEKNKYKNELHWTQYRDEHIFHVAW